MLLAGGLRPAHAQFRSLWSPPQVAHTEPVVLYAHWEGRQPLEGVRIELPSGWRLARAHVVQNGRTSQPLRVAPTGVPGTYLADANEPLRGAADVVLAVEPNGALGEAVWTVTPLRHEADGAGVPREAYRVGRRLQVRSPRPPGPNQALQVRAGEAPVLIPASALPSLAPEAVYSLLFWMRTTTPGAEVLSTWDGAERTAYPFEVTVDAAGRPVVYRSAGDQHQALRGRHPVADGTWHHVALVHDGPAGWTRLLVDGVPQDSLYDPTPAPVDYRRPLALGGRTPGRSTASRTTFDGSLDELQLWPFTLTAAEVRRALRQPAPAALGRALTLGFDEPVPARLLAPDSGTPSVGPADLSFFEPVRAFQAVRDASGGVTVSWQTRDEQTRAFIVERSADGARFEPVGRVEAEARTRGDTPASFSYLDPTPATPVAYYRIRQRLADGSDRLSSIIKLGLGPDRPSGAVLVGNFPNPFRGATTIGYEVKQPEQVRLSVWDLSGQQVAALVNRVQPPGYYEVQFEATDLPSGTYFIRLQTPSGSHSRKMLVMK